MESTLALPLPQLKSKVGDFLGHGRGVDYSDPEWDRRQNADILDCIESGQRRFYFPNTNPPYRWSFLRPMTSATFAEGESTVPLPDDFAGIEGRIAITDSSDSVFAAMDFYPEGVIQQLYSTYPNVTGRPQALAVRPLRGTTAIHSTRSELYVYPVADADYTLHFQYYLLPNAISIARPFAYGGAEHAETMLEACLAVAEERRDDMQGVHARAFEQRLMASIAADRAKKPSALGYNRDESDRRDRRPISDRWVNHHAVTINGVEYN